MNIGAHHAHVRKRLYKNLEPYPNQDRFKRGFDYLMYVVGALAPLALVPQVVTIYAHRDVSGLSFTTWALLTGVNILWLAYGILHREHPIIIANTGMVILNLTVVVGIVLYRF